MKLALEHGATVGLAMPVSGAAESAMKTACEADLGGQDFSSVFETQKKK